MNTLEPTIPRRRTGKIARLPKNLRDLINQMLDEGSTYSDIITKLAEHKIDLNHENISNWHHGGYQDWREKQDFRDQIHSYYETLLDLRDSDPAPLAQAVLQVALIEVFKQIRSADIPVRHDDASEDGSKPDPNYLPRLLGILPRLTHQILSLQKYQDTKPTPGGLAARRQAAAEEREAVLDLIDDYLGCKAYRRKPLSAQPPFMEIPKPQAPNPQPPAALVPAPEQSFNLIQSKSNEDPSSKSETISNPEPVSKAPEKVPPPEVQATPLPAKPEPVQEHCLSCGRPLPPLLPTGERPDHWCKCGAPLSAPGTSIRQRCPACWAYLPLEGYKIESDFSTCLKCGALLPKIRPPWAPPLPPQPAAA